VTVTPVSGGRDLDTFIKMPWSIYKGNPNWVPPLLRLEQETFDPKRNAFYQHADVQLFVARRGEAVLGRVSAHIDHEHNRYHNERTGMFGFFESVDDPAVAKALLAVAEDWLRARGMERSRGPLSFSTNGIAGFLTDAFDKKPVVMMPYNSPYYLDLMDRCGYGRIKDLYAWLWGGQPVSGTQAKIVEELRSRPEVTIRRARMNDFENEVRTILDLYNDAWAENWGYVPATDAEAEQLARDVRMLADAEIVPFVEVDGVPVGVALALPNLNEAIADLDGRLFPLGWAKLLWRLRRKRFKSGRLMLLGIKKEFRTRKYAGLAYLLCDEIYRGARERGYEWAEFSWTLEDNHLINSLIGKIGAVHYKTYRLFEKAL
jgi:GNAT superfamily N-acetyltransferase